MKTTAPELIIENGHIRNIQSVDSWNRMNCPVYHRLNQDARYLQLNDRERDWYIIAGMCAFIQSTFDNKVDEVKRSSRPPSFPIEQ